MGHGNPEAVRQSYSSEHDGGSKHQCLIWSPPMSAYYQTEVGASRLKKSILCSQAQLYKVVPRSEHKAELPPLTRLSK